MAGGVRATKVWGLSREQGSAGSDAVKMMVRHLGFCLAVSAFSVRPCEVTVPVDMGERLREVSGPNLDRVVGE